MVRGQSCPKPPLSDRAGPGNQEIWKKTILEYPKPLRYIPNMVRGQSSP
jgi:hypothetical protein